MKGQELRALLRVACLLAAEKDGMVWVHRQSCSHPKSKNASCALAVLRKPTVLPTAIYTLEVTVCQGPKWENGMTYGEDGKPGFSRQTEKFRR
jgi:hypothetical protein